MYRNNNVEWQRTLLNRNIFEGPYYFNEESNDFIPPLIPVRAHEVPDRPDSPLPPLIIEMCRKESNGHNEPEEYYTKLVTKLRIFYHKLFIENKDLSSEDYNLISDNESDLDFEQEQNDQKFKSRVDDVESEGTDFRQITTEALVHVDGSQDRSLLVPTQPTQRSRRKIHARNDVYDRLEVLSALEDNGDPGTPATLAHHNNEHIEVMRTPRSISQESIQMTCWSNSNKTSEHTAPKKNQHSIPATRRSSSDAQEPTAGSSSSQDGGQNNEFKISDDIHVSTSNVSRNAQENASIRGKRKFNEDSAERPSKRDESRGIFFGGTRKIFKNCTCEDHICD